MMIGVPLRRCADGDAAGRRIHGGDRAGGADEWSLCDPCDGKTAIGIACGMLGVDEGEARGELWDALGEVCNMVIGNFKGKQGGREKPQCCRCRR